MEIDKINIGTRLKDFRKSRGLTLKTLAQSINTSTGYLSDIERGIAKISVDILISLYRNYSADILYILTGEASHTTTNNAVAEPQEIYISTIEELRAEIIKLRSRNDALQDALAGVRSTPRTIRMS